MYALVIIASLFSGHGQVITVVESVEPSHYAACVQTAQQQTGRDQLATCVSTDGAAKLTKGCTLRSSSHVETAYAIGESDDLAGYAVMQFECGR